MTLRQAKRLCWMCRQREPGGFACGLTWHMCGNPEGRTPCLAMEEAVKPKTYHEGAEDERRAVKARLKGRMLKAGSAEELAVLRTEYAWVQGRCDRYKKRKGGL